MAEASIRESKVNNLEAMKSKGVNPYPIKYSKTVLISEILEKFKGLTINEEGFPTESLVVKTAGRLMLSRMQGKAGFCVIKDDSAKMQIYVRKDFIGEPKFEVFKHVDIGDIIGVQGEVFRTRTGETTVKVTDFDVLSKSILPLPEKYHGLTDKELRYRQRYLDLIMNDDVRDIFRKRSLIVRRIRELLQSKGFMEVETPMMQAIYGGAAAKPFITHHNTLDMDLYLRIAPELYLKRLIVGGFEKVFEINRNFRNEGISFKHNPEFTMMELYQAYADYNDMMELVQEIVLEANKAVNPSNVIQYGDAQIDITPPWRKVKLFDILKEKSGLDFRTISDEDARSAAKKMGIVVEGNLSKWKILDEVFKIKVEPELLQPVIIYDYPRIISPLAKEKPEDPEIVERFEPFIAGQEIGNAFSELNDPIEQKQRFLSQLEERKKGDDEAQVMDEDYVNALEYGMPPTGGLGVGIDRLVAILLNQHSIRDVILFPQLRKE